MAWKMLLKVSSLINTHPNQGPLHDVNINEARMNNNEASSDGNENYETMTAFAHITFQPMTPCKRKSVLIDINTHPT